MSAETKPTKTTTTQAASAADLTAEFVNKAGLAPQVDQLPAARDFVGELGVRLQDWLDKQGTAGTVPKRARAVLTALMSELDAKLSDQVNEVMHAPEFQKMEASWRGLEYLVKKTEPDPMIRFRVLDVSKEELLDDFEAAPQEQLSSLFLKTYEAEFGMYGGQPFGLLVGDYEFSHDTRDVSLLTSISRVAAASHAPFIAASSPQMFGWNDFTQMQDKPGGLASIFDPTVDPSYAPWKAFRASEESRYVGLCMPHMLLREPHRPSQNEGGLFVFQEDVLGNDRSKFLWGNAAYALATRMTEAFFDHRWCVSIRGPRGGGLVEGLPSYTFTTERGDVGQMCPTEVAIDDRRDNELAELGFIPLVHCKNTVHAAFFATPTCQEPKKWNTDEANANSLLSARLQYIMATSRFAHYLKSMMRDYVGAYMTRAECQDFLSRWIADYVTTAEGADYELKSKRPLSAAQITVEDDAARPGCYKATALLRPHFQLESLNISLRLVAELPPPRS
jgi:type VI secretion system protein ImpC